MVLSTKQAIIIANRLANQMYKDGLETYASCEVFDKLVDTLLTLTPVTQEKLYECYFIRRTQETETATGWQQYYDTSPDTDDDSRQ